jgi:hypothetical protein
VILLVKHGKFGLNSEVFNGIWVTLLGKLIDQLVDLAEIISLRNITKCSITSFSYKKILLLQSQLGDSLPISFSLWCEFKRLKNLDSFFETIVLQG